MTREEAIKTLHELWRETNDSWYEEAFRMAVEALKEHKTTTIKLNNQIHLCDSCKYDYPNCPSENEDVLFGNGIGDDNICCCAKYIVSVDRPHGEWIEVCDTSRICSITRLQCSKCGEEWLPEYTSRFNHCPNCGALMGGDTK